MNIYIVVANVTNPLDPNMKLYAEEIANATVTSCDDLKRQNATSPGAIETYELAYKRTNETLSSTTSSVGINPDDTSSSSSSSTAAATSTVRVRNRNRMWIQSVAKNKLL